MTRTDLEPLVNAIAGALASEKAYNLPAVCVRLGLAEGEGGEAQQSKRTYVRKRLSGRNQAQLLDIAEKVLEDYQDPTLTDVVSELTAHSRQRVTELTRRNVLKLLDELPSLFGEMNLYSALSVLNAPLDQLSNLHTFGSLADEIEQHWVRSDDWSNSELLERCGAFTCAQHRFFSLIEKTLDPLARQGEEQASLAKNLSATLKPDGFEVAISRYVSGVPAYSVRICSLRPQGHFKNIIFASTGEKPQIVLRDAINNDVEITKNADLCLIYDRPLSSTGLLWTTMAEWWKDRWELDDLDVARKSLGARLTESVKLTGSPGEYAIFRTYYETYTSKLGKALPALIPQVYLHFDPYNNRTRRGPQVLVRQRMDFLLLLKDGARVVIEVDGKQHYAEGDLASPALYAKMIAEDRRLRLAGYELYRFGGAEFPDLESDKGRHTIGPQSRASIMEFFDSLFELHAIGSSNSARAQ